MMSASSRGPMLTGAWLRAALDAVRQDGDRTLAALEATVEAARKRLAEEQARVEKAVAKAEAAVDAAEEAYRKAGG